MSFLGAIAGGLGGLAMGGPLGAAAGAAAGLMGSGEQGQSTRYNMRPMTEEERRIVQMLEERIPDYIQTLSPQGRRELSEQFTQLARERGMQAVEEQFNAIEGQYRLNMARTGGGLGSVDAYRSASLGRQRARAENEVGINARLFGEQVAGNRQAEALNMIGGMSGAMGNIYGLRTIGAGQTTTFRGNEAGGGMTMLGYAAMDEDSWLRNL